MKFKTDEEAVRLIHASDFGLGGSVFTDNKDRADHFTKHLKTGMLNINDFAINYLCQSLPFGGRGISGFGRFAGIEGLRGECHPRAVTVDKFLWMKTRIPPVLGYPTSVRQFSYWCDQGKSWKACDALGHLIYGNGILERTQATLQLLKQFLSA